jgi:hypothetical protein
VWCAGFNNGDLVKGAVELTFNVFSTPFRQAKVPEFIAFIFNVSSQAVAIFASAVYCERPFPVSRFFGLHFHIASYIYFEQLQDEALLCGSCRTVGSGL